MILYAVAFVLIIVIASQIAVLRAIKKKNPDFSIWPSVAASPEVQPMRKWWMPWLTFSLAFVVAAAGLLNFPEVPLNPWLTINLMLVCTLIPVLALSWAHGFPLRNAFRFWLAVAAVALVTRPRGPTENWVQLHAHHFLLWFLVGYVLIAAAMSVSLRIRQARGETK
jgi:hypothetical protein